MGAPCPVVAPAGCIPRRSRPFRTGAIGDDRAVLVVAPAAQVSGRAPAMGPTGLPKGRRWRYAAIRPTEPVDTRRAAACSAARGDDRDDLARMGLPSPALRRMRDGDRDRSRDGLSRNAECPAGANDQAKGRAIPS